MQVSDVCVQFLLRKALQRVNRISKSKLSQYGVTPAQFGLLSLLWKRDGQLGHELGERLSLDSATITGIIDRLEQNDFTERRIDSKDRRNRLVFLTEKGRSLENTLRQEMKDMNEEVMNGFAEEDFHRFKEMLLDIGSKDKDLTG